MLDLPDPRPGRHAHLYLHHQVEHARHEIERSWTPSPVMAQCQLCGATVDLCTVVKPEQPREEDLPPVRGRWSRRARPLIPDQAPDSAGPAQPT